MCQKHLIRCQALPCFFWHENLHVLVELHQDDFHCTAPVKSLMGRDQAEVLRECVSRHALQPLGYMSKSADCGQFTLHDRHLGNDGNAEVVRSGNPKPVEICWKAEEHRIFRRVLGIARFLRTLRPDVGFAVKELSHRLAASGCMISNAASGSVAV